mgnify:CR=1 FL=1
MKYLELLLYGIYPYVALSVFVIFSLNRFINHKFSYSSLSSQFLENKTHFWGLVPFHYGLIFVLSGHLVAFLLPAQILAWNSNITRLYILEISAFIGGILTLVGMITIFYRRLKYPRIKVVTSNMDWIILGLILLQVSAGLWTAIFHSWGSSWFAGSAAPYLWSIFQLSPDIGYIVPLPLIPRLHIIGAWSILLLFPFSRLVHVLVVPNPYLWRKPQMVRWYWNRKKRFIQ